MPTSLRSTFLFLWKTSTIWPLHPNLTCFFGRPQAPDAPVGAHSDAIDVLPEKLLAIARQYDMDIMLESKDKEQSLGKLLVRYFARGVDDGRLTYALKADKV